MSTFEYLTVLLSIIIGVGITHMIMGVGRLISHTSGKKIYWIHFLWTINIVLYLVSYWWWAFNLRDLTTWSFLPFLLVLLEPSLLCLAGAILYPVSMPSDLDYEDHFYKGRRAFFSVIVAVSVCDLILVFFSAPDEHFTTLGWAYQTLLATSFIGGLIAANVDDERFQGAFAVAYCCSLFTFIWVTQRSIPA